MLHVDIYCKSPFSHIFLKEFKEMEITDNWNCNCLQSYVWGVMYHSLGCGSCTQDYRKVDTISASQAFLKNPMNKGYSHMINCPHLRIFKEF
jgi:hypothetical protein